MLYLIAGCAISPAMIVATSLTQQIVPARQLTESITWTVAGLGVGVALGSAAVGQVIDHVGVTAGFGVGIAAGLIAVACATGIHLRSRIQ